MKTVLAEYELWGLLLELVPELKTLIVRSATLKLDGTETHPTLTLELYVTTPEDNNRILLDPISGAITQPRLAAALEE